MPILIILALIGFIVFVVTGHVAMAIVMSEFWIPLVGIVAGWSLSVLVTLGLFAAINIIFALARD